ncbi:hypothetical protein QTI17_30505 [Variovorax sp. J31P179]|uniref:hypothetical protein n=1 Tax=Variovorax sp. J31P179 TaxID=3053508 RepID=UPI002577A333|nr:hypothetical protein [Variovorax sp. J31P179]MDM0084936.1 hypothetical protein [Variovorax sp. J31P179]
MTWLLFFSRTFWRVLVHPQSVAARALADLDDQAATRFAGLVSPPLLLMLTILLAHGVEIEIHDNVLALLGQSGLVQRVTAKETKLLIFRVIGNSIVPLVMAYGFVRRQGLEVDAITPRSPFYLQCFFSAPLVVTGHRDDAASGGQRCRSRRHGGSRRRSGTWAFRASGSDAGWRSTDRGASPSRSDCSRCRW